MKNNSLSEYKVLLVTLITSLSITGISLIDDQIWNLIILIIGMIAYSIVGILYSLHVITGKNAGKDAYAVVFIVLLILGYCVYQGIVKFQQWVLSWPLWIKILIPVILTLLIILVITIMIIKSRQNTNQERTD